MKKKFIKLLVFTSVGTVFYTGQNIFAADNQVNQVNTQSGQPNSNLESRTNSISQTHLYRAGELIGTDVRNQQDEKIGVVKDLMVDLQSGRAPFAVVASGGFFGVGDRLMAVPATTFAQMADKNGLVLKMDRERMKSAPSFDKNYWPDMMDPTWNSQVYSFYGAQPYWQSSATASASQIIIYEPAGAQLSTQRKILPEVYSEIESGLNPDRAPRQGLGVEDLTRNELRMNSGALIKEPAGAEKRNATTTTIIRENITPTRTTAAQMDKVKRASELMGMEVKNAQNERIGEIKDLVIDLQSGRVAYAVLEAGGLPELDKLYAVPPNVFTRSTDGRWLVFNTDKETLKSAPAFEKNNWPNNQKFTMEVYRFYHQRPYWQTSGEIREPSGAAPATQTPGAEIKESPQTEPERYQGRPPGSQKSLENQSQGSATKETSEVQTNNSTNPQKK